MLVLYRLDATVGLLGRLPRPLVTSTPCKAQRPPIISGAFVLPISRGPMFRSSALIGSGPPERWACQKFLHTDGACHGFITAKTLAPAFRNCDVRDAARRGKLCRRDATATNNRNGSSIFNAYALAPLPSGPIDTRRPASPRRSSSISLRWNSHR